MTTVRQQYAMLALFILAGLALASPVARTASLLLITLSFAFIVGSVVVGRYGARSVAFGCLAVTGVLAPMNALRLNPAITLADLFLIPSGVLAVIAQARLGPTAPADRRAVRPDILAALLLIGGGLVGSQFAGDLGSSLSAIVRFGLAAVGVPLVFVAVAPSRTELRALCWAFLVGSSINSVVGVVTYDPFDRGIGLSTHSNHLALGCLLASGFAAGLFLTSPRRSATVAAAFWAIVTVGILKSGSRAGALGAAILLVVVLFSTGSTRIVRWCLVVFVGVGALLYLNVVPYDEQDAIARLLGRDRSAVEMSNLGRAQLRAEAIENIEKHPLTGAGFEEARVAHNLYLQVWGAAGIVGLLGLAVLWNAAIRGVLEGADGDRLALGASAATLSFLVIAVASNILWDRYLWYGLAIFVTGRVLQPKAAQLSTEALAPLAVG